MANEENTDESEESVIVSRLIITENAHLRASCCSTNKVVLISTAVEDRVNDKKPMYLEDMLGAQIINCECKKKAVTIKFLTLKDTVANVLADKNGTKHYLLSTSTLIANNDAPIIIVHPGQTDAVISEKMSRENKEGYAWTDKKTLRYKEKYMVEDTFMSKVHRGWTAAWTWPCDLVDKGLVNIGVKDRNEYFENIQQDLSEADWRVRDEKDKVNITRLGQNIQKADGFIENVAAYGNYFKYKVTTPSSWTIQGVLGDALDPTTYIGGAVVKIPIKTGIKASSKVVSSGMSAVKNIAPVGIPIVIEHNYNKRISNQEN